MQLQVVRDRAVVQAKGLARQAGDSGRMTVGLLWLYPAIKCNNGVTDCPGQPTPA